MLVTITIVKYARKLKEPPIARNGKGLVSVPRKIVKRLVVIMSASDARVEKNRFVVRAGAIVFVNR